ncbi:carboxypeptidase-like regulatory domain-containing protein [Aeromicrobium stalagmiti]|uniref:carboxypeptidase-like regulatory domain-containing protein n=1 Tax=Aeromicrobium stalagmiti TaxID=2738988 RepID=UPI00156A39B0|nr:carboxypeptidase-like regulatory domain-containing protein [Aeromicrobium stalagmiti]NRQ48877.1 carboxypeptidase regulatory-like domain-containing protein [Aeromicrobium stalagmiti]
MKLHHHVRVPALLLGVIALLLAGLTLPAHAATKNATVKGVVTVDGTPIKGVTIELYVTGDDGYQEPRVATAVTDSKGAYSIRFSPTNPIDVYVGSTILIKDPQYRIVSTSRRFMGVANKTVTRNASVKKAGSITGTVKRGDGKATGLLRVVADGPSSSIDPGRDLPINYDQDVKVAADGSFALRGLPSGNFSLQSVDDGQTYFSQCYDNLIQGDEPCIEQDAATTVPLATGQNVTLEPQTLSTAGHRISGIVTDTSGRPIGHTTVEATQDGGSDRLNDRNHPTTGAFRIGPLSGDGYRLTAKPDFPWAPQTADSVIDVSGGDVTGVQIKVKSQATIKATLTPGTGTVKVAVDVTRAATGSKPSGKATIRWGTISKTVDLVDGKGTVKLQGLPAGKRQITVSYAGTSSTAAATKLFYATVK